ncbi:MAG TPA: hypothetical protein VKI65_18945 [Gemmataceae bacterium]|nr:hypothetical protein [Gemmataceae bacterium]
MTRNDKYTDLEGREVSLTGLDEAERKLVSLLRRRAATHPNWTDFDNFWTKAVADFYDARGLTRKQSSNTAVFRIAQDLSSRLAVRSGMARLPDYRDELEELIRSRFRTRRAFCKATGLSEDLLSHVLAGRKHLSLPTLSTALERIGYRLRISPLPGKKKTA